MEERLKKEKVGKLLLSLAIPAICAQMVTLLYNLVDRIYIGRMEDGALAMAAIGLCVPLTTVINAFNGLFGRGGSPLSSMALGRQDKVEANRILTQSFMLLLVSSLLITLCFLAFQEPILYYFGASEQTIGYAKDYASIYVLGTVFVQLTVGLNYYIHAQGFAKYGMMTVLLGAGLNILLDPVLIFGLDLGIKGAALATILSQAISCFWVLRFFRSSTSILHIQKQYLHFHLPTIKKMIILGLSPFFMSLSEGLLTICFNQQLFRFGRDLAVSAMTIMNSMWQFILLPIEGVAQASQPIISYNYGACSYQRVEKTLSLAFKATCAYSLIGVGLMIIFPHIFVGLFTDDPALLKLGSQMLPIYMLGGSVMGINSTCQQTYNSLGDGKKSFFFAFLRKIILLIPLIYILPRIFTPALFAVIAAEPIADFVTTWSNYIYFKGFIRKKLNLDQLSQAMVSNTRSI